MVDPVNIVVYITWWMSRLLNDKLCWMMSDFWIANWNMFIDDTSFNWSCQKILDVGKTRRILVTGGASANNRILQIISDVFNAPVYIQVLLFADDISLCNMSPKNGIFCNLISSNNFYSMKRQTQLHLVAVIVLYTYTLEEKNIKIMQKLCLKLKVTQAARLAMLIRNHRLLP